MTKQHVDYHDDVRMSLRFSGVQKAKILEACELLGYNTGADLGRYLVLKGLQDLTPQMESIRMIRKMGADYSPEQMVKTMIEGQPLKMGGEK